MQAVSLVGAVCAGCQRSLGAFRLWLAESVGTVVGTVAAGPGGGKRMEESEHVAAAAPCPAAAAASVISGCIARVRAAPLN